MTARAASLRSSMVLCARAALSDMWRSDMCRSLPSACATLLAAARRSRRSRRRTRLRRMTARAASLRCSMVLWVASRRSAMLDLTSTRRFWKVAFAAAARCASVVL